MNLSRVFVAQIMRDLNPVVVDVRRRRALRRRLVKVPTGYDILMIMISLSTLDLRTRYLPMETEDTYYG